MLPLMEASPFLKLISLSLLLAWYPPVMAVLPSLEEQAGALLAWKANHQSQPAQLQSWEKNIWPCSWHGISCSNHTQAGHQLEFPVITGISLWGSGLTGELDNLNFSALASLTSIKLAHNQIRGSFPSALASSLPNLRHLMLQENELSGEIPKQIGQLESLVGLNLSANRLSGPIPSELGSLKKLLVGPIPINLGNATKLTILYLDGNQLSGHLPRELATR
ncbi:hypothetical protein QYE76_030102 [Lolium multiflorum]|uniref:Leucine-rich repeat-containing N-terminal plant-type domain-containing protein n=1 Tax=Lolium multiflorum TaxID=4521 RepID=A0AAD8QQY6_LOLMU|nr:hypothetical protein QYE76_030102 [Lolium multiflorum]